MMASNTSLNSIDSDVFTVEQLSSEPNPQRNNSPNIFSSTELSGMHTRELPTLFLVTSPEPDIVILDANSSDATLPYGFGAQQPLVPLSLNDLNLPTNLCNILAGMTVVQLNPVQHDKKYSPPVTRAVGTITHFNPTHEFHYDWRLGNSSYHDRW